MTTDQLAQLLERVADRLRVLGPRLAARDDADARRLVAVIHRQLQSWEDRAAAEQSRPVREVPVLAPWALADQALVLGHELLAACADESGRTGARTLLEQVRQSIA